MPQDEKLAAVNEAVPAGGREALEAPRVPGGIQFPPRLPLLRPAALSLATALAARPVVLRLVGRVRRGFRIALLAAVLSVLTPAALRVPLPPLLGVTADCFLFPFAA